MIFHLNHNSGVPVYLQLMEQVKHAAATGALHAGEQIPTIRKLAEELVMNPNTVVRAYRELDHEGIIELRHGSGAFIRESSGERTKLMKKGAVIVQAAVERLAQMGLSEQGIRRLVESKLAETEKLIGAK